MCIYWHTDAAYFSLSLNLASYWQPADAIHMTAGKRIIPECMLYGPLVYLPLIVHVLLHLMDTFIHVCLVRWGPTALYNQNAKSSSSVLLGSHFFFASPQCDAKKKKKTCEPEKCIWTHNKCTGCINGSLPKRKDIPDPSRCKTPDGIKALPRRDPQAGENGT